MFAFLLLKLFSDEFEFLKFFRQVCQNVFKTLFRVFFVIFCHKVCYFRDALCAVPYSDIKLFFIAENRVYAVAEIGLIAARPGVFFFKIVKCGYIKITMEHCVFSFQKSFVYDIIAYHCSFFKRLVCFLIKLA